MPMSGQYQIFILPRNPRSGVSFYFGASRTLLYFVSPQLPALSGTNSSHFFQIFGISPLSPFYLEEVLAPLARLVLETFHGEMKSMVASLSVNDPKEKLGQASQNVRDPWFLFIPHLARICCCWFSRILTTSGPSKRTMDIRSPSA